MSIDTAFVMSATARRAAFRDLDLVTTTAAVTTDDGTRIEAGARGTVVGVWPGGREIEVEFVEPVAGLATVQPGDIRLDADAA